MGPIEHTPNTKPSLSVLTGASGEASRVSGKLSRHLTRVTPGDAVTRPAASIGPEKPPGPSPGWWTAHPRGEPGAGPVPEHGESRAEHATPTKENENPLNDSRSCNSQRMCTRLQEGGRPRRAAAGSSPQRGLQLPHSAAGSAAEGRRGCTEVRRPAPLSIRAPACWSAHPHPGRGCPSARSLHVNHPDALELCCAHAPGGPPSAQGALAGRTASYVLAQHHCG